jgi:hypothetical protein
VKNADEIAKKYGGSRLDDALKKYGGVPVDGGNTTLAPAADNSTILAQQAAKYPTVAESGTASPAADRGVWAGLKRAASNLNPLGMAQGVLSNLPHPMTADEIPSPEQFNAGLEHLTQHPVGTAVRTALPAGLGDLAAPMVERAPADPLGAATEAIGTAAAIPIAERLHAGIQSRFPPPSADLFAQTQHLSTALGIDPESAVASQPFLKSVFQKFGLDPAQIPLSESRSLRRSDPYGNLYRGGTPEQLVQVNHQLQLEHQSRNALRAIERQRTGASAAEKFTTTPALQFKSIIPAIANEIVDVAHQPFERVMAHFGQVRTPNVQSAVIGDLESALARNSGPDGVPIDRGLDTAIRARIAAVRSSGDAAGGINTLKAHANKEVGKLSSRSPSAQVAATATPVYSYQLLADAARRHLYPELEAMGAPGVREAGIAEHHAIMTRDNMLANWGRSTGQNAPVALQGYLSYVFGGPQMGLKAVLSPGSMPGQVVSMLGRIPGKALPLSEFNRHLSLGVGPLDNFTLPSIDINPNALYKEPTASPYDLKVHGKAPAPSSPSPLGDMLSPAPPSPSTYNTSSKGKSLVPASATPPTPLIDPLTGRVVPRYQP